MVVVITGAGSGIGRATAQRFGAGGAKVHACDLHAGPVEEVCEEIRARGAAADAHVLDVSDADAVATLAERVFAADGGVDVLHNNAGIVTAGNAWEMTVEDWNRQIAVNLMGPIYGVHAFVPKMLAQGRPAHIINTASLAGLAPLPRLAAYSAAKHGVVGLTEALNIELAPRGIRVSAVCPGGVNTPIVTAAVVRGASIDRGRLAELAGRFGAAPEDIAEAVVATVRKPRVIRIVPAAMVAPAWLLHRVTPRGYQLAGRLLASRLPSGY